MRRASNRQLGFELLENSTKKFFGGSYLRNSHAKTKRPITTKSAMHLVMRSSKAIGKKSFLRYHLQILDILNRQAELHGVKIYKFANAGNHLHLIVLPRSRDAFKAFLRSVSGLIVRLVMRRERGVARVVGREGEGAAEKNGALKKNGALESIEATRFWDQRPFTRILAWGRDFNRAKKYLTQNTLEAFGFRPLRKKAVGHVRRFSSA